MALSRSASRITDPGAKSTFLEVRFETLRMRTSLPDATVVTALSVALARSLSDTMVSWVLALLTENSCADAPVPGLDPPVTKVPSPTNFTPSTNTSSTSPIVESNLALVSVKVLVLASLDEMLVYSS